MRQTLLSLLDNCASRAEETAIVHLRGLRISRWSYGRLAATAYQFASELESCNIGKGDRILLWAENSPEWVAAFFGCLLRDAVAVPLDRLSAPDLILRVQQQVTAKLLLHSHAVRPEAGLDLPTLRLDELSEAIAYHSSSPYSVKNINGNDLIEIIFTSGTTAEPKGVCLTHRNFLASLAPLEEEIGRRRRWARIFHPVRFLNLLPLSHVFGQYMGMFAPQLLGGEVYFREALNPSEIIETVRKHRITVITAFPRLLDTLRERVERDYAASPCSESIYASGGARPPEPTGRNGCALFPEGQRTPDGRRYPFLAGAGLLVEKLNVPVIPVRIDGLFALKQNRRYHARPGEVTVTFGAPVRFPPGVPPAQITKTLERQIAAL